MLLCIQDPLACKCKIADKKWRLPCGIPLEKVGVYSEILAVCSAYISLLTIGSSVGGLHIAFVKPSKTVA